MNATGCKVVYVLSDKIIHSVAVYFAAVF